MLTIALLGGVQFQKDGTPLQGFISSKAQALLCYLAVTRRPQRRDSLCGLLWAEKPDADARLSLRVALSNLHRLVPGHLAISRDAIAFNTRSEHWLDVEAFEPADAGAGGSPPSDRLTRLHEQERLYRGDFLEGFHVRDAPAFEEWAMGPRARYRRLALDAIYLLAAHYSQHRDYAAAIEHTSRLLLLEPWQEEAHRQLIQLLSDSGQRSAALAQYEICRRMLAEEFGVAPSPETQALVARIRAAT